MSFRERLKQWRESQGWSQAELANRSSVSNRSISRWEVGDGLPGGDALVELSKLGCDPTWLLTGHSSGQVQSQTVAPAANPNLVRDEIDADLIADIETLLEEWLGRHGRRMEPRQRGRFIAEAYAFCMEEVVRAQEPVDGVATRVVGRLLRLVA